MGPRKEFIQTYKKSPHHHTPGRRKIVNADCKNFAKMKRFAGNIGGNHSKDHMLLKLQKCLSCGAKLGKEIIVGFNSVNKLIEQNNAEVVCVAKDTHTNILNCIIEVCTVRKIPFVLLPNLTEHLVNIFKLKSVSCFALTKHSIPSAIEQIKTKRQKKQIVDNNSADDTGFNEAVSMDIESDEFPTIPPGPAAANAPSNGTVEGKNREATTGSAEADMKEKLLQELAVNASIDSLKEYILSIVKKE